MNQTPTGTETSRETPNDQVLLMFRNDLAHYSEQYPDLSPEQVAWALVNAFEKLRASGDFGCIVEYFLSEEST